MVKKIKKKEEEKKRKTAAIIMLLIMLLSVIGFAALSNPSGTIDKGKEADIPLQRFNSQDQTFWGARINGEEFIFLSIDGFDQRDDLRKLAEEIKKQKTLRTYIDLDYKDFNGPYLLENKFKNAFSKNIYRVDNISDCSQPTIIFTYNPENFPENCIFFSPKMGEEARDSEILTYFLIK